MLEFSPVSVVAPASSTRSIPLVLDSPHSGRRYPADFAFACDPVHLRKAEDTDIDDLYAAAPALGATLVCAEFPRSYIDPNRRLEDVDPSMFSGRWTRPVDASPKTKSGIGLVWRVLDDGSPIYARSLSVSEVEARIEQCYTPYWQALTDVIESCYSAHQKVFHINCHSMPAEASPISWIKPGTKFADIVLGDRDGSTCSPEYTQMFRDAFAAEGLNVAINDPYKGVELVKRFGKPSAHRHSIQIEINRRLYMNEATRERSANYAHLKASIGRVLEKTAAFVA
ncbi:MAG: N-formylglutamate amidohydrolase [Betaproteobacteria bacterium]|nr:MAG: N-formylglutamate amidohydrolase [Betaproteobacteria bacterium]